MIGKPGEKQTTIDRQQFVPEFEPLPIEDLSLTNVHEKRKTVLGRKRLVQEGVSMKGYRKGNGDYSEIPFTERRFISWDGEGGFNIQGPACMECIHNTCDLIRFYGETNSATSHYILFGNSDGDYISSPSLSSQECLTLICTGTKDAIHIGFAFGYDVNMIIKDLPVTSLWYLKENGFVRWKRWRIEYRPKKWFMVTDCKAHKTVRIWDVWTYFMTSAIVAWEVYEVSVSDVVIAGKLYRAAGTHLELERIKEYWYEENQAYVQLMDKLRNSLHAAGLFISSWHGPGAIASYSMRKHNIDKTMAKCPKPVNLAAQYAYGGGRFELFRVGRANCKVYEYDVNSAYPYAISQLPNLARGEWIHRISPERIARYGVYRISWKQKPWGDNLRRPQPFFCRDGKGQISFPCIIENTWVWSPELEPMAGTPGLTIHEGWEFREDDPTDRPFAWLAENYAIRKQYKEPSLEYPNGNPAEKALKLQMNSMYGKMAQRVGWNVEKRSAPKWHQLENAGWVTSYCRSMVFGAAIRAGTDILAFETDAVFSLRPLAEQLDIGDDLGQWEETVYDDFVYLQSGCRFGLKNGEWKAKYRGFDKGSISLDSCLSALAKSPDEWKVSGTTSRFIGFAQALHQDFTKWRQFLSGTEREMRIGGEGKRRHMAKLCRACRNGESAANTLHDCTLGMPIAGESVKHMLPWLDGQIDESQAQSDMAKWEIDVSI